LALASQPSIRQGHERGFTFLGVLILLAIIAMVSVSTLQVGSIVQRRAAEESLLDVGAAFRDALTSYRRMTPDGRPDAPDSLEELLKDPRFPGTVRHLRRVYADPLTGSNKWGIIRAADSTGIIGVYSLSEAKPIKVANFDAMFQGFTGTTSYRQWEFVAGGNGGAATAGVGGNNTKSAGIRPLDLPSEPELAPFQPPAPAGIRPLDLE
jgi:type II secretory pathway pseudopilin PulG